MAINPLSTWKSELAALEKVGDSTWATNFAQYYADQIAGIEPDPLTLSAVGFTFTFNTSVFASGLLSLPPSDSAATSALGIANAWEAAILGSIVVVGPGSSIQPATPSTTFSVVFTTIIDPVSIAAGKAKVLELASATPVEDPNDSIFPEILRDATLLLTITVTGLSSDLPPPGGPGPLPLTAPLVALT
jgi:hypothetical protein